MIPSIVHGRLRLFHASQFGDRNGTEGDPVISLHYQGLSTPALYRALRNRRNDKGRVRIWNTESWEANTDDRFLGMVAAARPADYDRVLASLLRGAVSSLSHGRVHHGRIHTEDSMKGVVRPLKTWAPAAVYSASQQYLGPQKLDRVMFKCGLPESVDGEHSMPGCCRLQRG